MYQRRRVDALSDESLIKVHLRIHLNNFGKLEILSASSVSQLKFQLPLFDPIRLIRYLICKRESFFNLSISSCVTLPVREVHNIFLSKQS